MQEQVQQEQGQPQEEDKRSLVNIVKRWMKFYRLHRSLPLSVPIPQTAQVNLDSQSFILLIHRIEGLKPPSSNDLKLCVNVIVNFFMAGEAAQQIAQNTTKQVQGTVNKCFFGRTYESPRIPVDFLPDNISYEHQPINIYYHTKICGKESPLILIIEIQIFEQGSGDLTLRRQTLGWCEIGATTITNPIRLTIRKGSPRVLLNQQVLQHENTAYTLLTELQYSQAFQLCSFLVPENVLCGFGDEIPGIFDNYIPSCSEIKDDKIELANSFVVYISSIQVMMPELLESEVYKQVQRFRSYKFRVSEDYKGDIQITTKRLVAGYHNGWTIVNSRGLNNFVPLADSRKTVQETIDGKLITFKLLEYQGVIDVNNIAAIQPDNDLNYGMLIFQLEYEVNNLGKQTMQIILGWLPVYLNDKIGMPSEMIEEDMIIGPGKTVTGKPLAYFTQSDLPIKIFATINLQGIGVAAVKEIVKQQQPTSENRGPTMNGQAIGERFKSTLQNETMDIKTQMKVREMEQQLQKLKDDNDRLRRGGGGAGLDYRGDDGGISRERQYLAKIDELREEQRLNLLTTAKQFEDLEKVLKNTLQQNAPTQQSRQQLMMPGGDQSMNILFDRSDLNRYKPIDSIQYPLPQSTLRPISKSDAAFLLQTGIPGLLDGDPEDADLTSAELETKTLRVEKEDDRKDSIIIIQPLAIKININDEEISDLKTLGFNVPKQLYFTIHFYDMPQFKTPNLMIEQANDLKALIFNIRNNTPLRIITLADQQTYNTKFTIDTSTLRYNNLHYDFIKYLYRKNLLIDVWDADSKMIFGSMKIPLRQVLRQGKQSNHLLKEVDVLDTNFKRIKGQLQILIRNIGRQSSSNTTLKDATFLNDKALSVIEKTKFIKKKIVSEGPIKMTDYNLGTSSKLVDAKDPNERISERIKNLKKQNFQSVSENLSTKQQQTRKLTEIDKYKELKRNAVVKTAIQEIFSEERILNSFFGKSEIVPFRFTNNYASSFTFQVNIDDPDSKYLNNPEFTLIINPSEWKFWVHYKGFPEPYSYDMVKKKQMGDRNQYLFFLEKDEQVTLLFKFLSFRNVDAELQFDPDAFSIAQQRGRDYIQKFIYPRHIQVFIQRVEGQNIADGFKILLEPHMQIVDHVLRYYERDNRQTKLVLPPLYTFVQPPDKKPIIHVTDEDVIIEWGKDNNEIKLCLKVKEVCSVRTFNVLAYTDAYSSEVVGNWQIEVHSLNGLDIEVPLGQTVASKLTLPCDITRVVRLFASHSSLEFTVSFPQQYSQEFTLMPGKLNLINFFIRSVSEANQSCQINCVDFNAQELVYGWIVKVNTVAQPPSALYEIKCIEGRETKHLINYVNQTNYLAQYQFTTSHPQYVKIIDEKLQIAPYERGEVRIKILTKSGVAQLEAKIFIQDAEERMFDTVLLKIRYTYN